MKTTEFSRRQFLKTASAAVAVAGTGINVGWADNDAALNKKSSRSDKPNILIITCDQLSWSGIAANGNKDTSSPAIDSIINNGTSFDQSYCSSPLCSPSRASFWTGRLPHITGVTGNVSKMIPEAMPTLGMVFSEAGYEAKHFGKRHDFGSLNGFDVYRELQVEVEGSEAYPATYQTKRDGYTVGAALDYLRQEHDKPFVMVAEFHNPHNINNWIGAYSAPHGDIPGMGVLPPLRPNYANDDLENRPDAIKYMCCTTRRQGEVSQWTDKNFQQYLKAYYHYTGLGDDCVAQILQGLAKSDAADNTLVVFLSDHGDAMGSHKLVAKSHFFYEEAAKVPFVLKGPGIPAGSRINSLTSLCDLLPTLCDYVGIQAPEGLYGQSLML